jgi:capsular exopolysaccharide synthesis family protein
MDPVPQMNTIVDLSDGGMGRGALESPMAPASSPPLASESTLVAHYLRLARRWKWVILAAVVVGAAAALVLTLLMTPQYSSTSTLEIAREKSTTSVEGIEPQVGSVDQEFYQTQYGLLQSRALAERVVRELKLTDNRHFLDLFDIGPSSGVLGDDRPLDNSASARQKRANDAADALLGNISVSPARMSRLVDVSFTSPDPSLSADIVNAWAKYFIQTTIERRFDATAYARKFLEQRLTELRARLDESERELVGYAGRQRIININTPSGTGTTGERPITADDLVAYNTALAQAKTDRIAAENAMRVSGASTKESVNSATLANLRDQRSKIASELAKLSDQFSPEYPQVKALTAQLAEIDTNVRAEENRISQALRGEYQRAAGRERELATNVAQLKNDMIDLQRRTIQYNILRREVDTNRTLYEGLLQRYKEIGIAGGIGANNISIVDPGEIAERPSSPRPLINLLLGLLLGGLVGAVLALALDQIDEAITEPLELERTLGIPSLGVVPRHDPDKLLEELLDRKSALSEAYLSIKTNLQFATPHGIPASIAITSTRASEGKSTTALALALSIAQQGRRVAIVDSDMRSPSLHKLLGIPNDAGFSSLLSGNAEISDVLRPGRLGNLTAITAGPHPPNAADLLSGVMLPKVVKELLQSFDNVLFDAPPLLGLADAPLLASGMEAVIYVVEANGVQSRSVKMAVNRLANSGTNIIGAILTKFETTKASYGYGYDYGYGYGSDRADDAK